MEGGVLQAVYSDCPVNISILDHDVLKENGIGYDERERMVAALTSDLQEQIIRAIDPILYRNRVVLPILK